MSSTTKPTMYMEFSNPGEVELNAFKLLGASTKRSQEGKIGFFGTGLKYAIALMLREGINFKAYIGEKEVKLGVRQTDFGGTKVGVITVNGEKTSMTTDAGINWQPWFAIREIYSNALDEGGTMELSDKFHPEAGKTKIYVEMSDKLGDITRDWQSYFTMKRESLEDIEIKQGSDVFTYRILAKREGQSAFTLFRRGIRVAKAGNVDSLFDYDVSEVKINESRVVEHDWEGRQRAAEALAQATDPNIVGMFVKSWTQPLLEHEDRFWYYLFDNIWSINSKNSFSQTWLQVLKPYRIVPSNMTGFYGVTKKTIGLPEKLIKRLYDQFGDDLTIEGLSKNHYIVTSEVFPEQFTDAHTILTEAGITFDKANIKLAKFRDYDVKGAWDRDAGIIVLGEDTVNYDEQQKIMLLLEEMLHAESGFSDNTRQFEGFIMGKLVNKILNDRVKA